MSDRKTEISGVAMVYAMERGLKPQGMVRHAEKICSVDLRSIEGVQLFANWRKTWEDIHGYGDEDRADRLQMFHNDEMHEIHAELVKRLKAKGLLIGRGAR